MAQGRNISYLRKTMTLGGLYALAKNVAKDYASTVPERARSILMDKYNLTESAYYHLLEMTVTHHLVSDETIKKMREKALVNQSVHGNAGKTSNDKYDVLEVRRREYSAIKHNDIKHIAEYFAEHPELSKKSISMTFSFTSSKVLDQILYKACKELIISDETFEKIKKRSLASATNLGETQRFFAHLDAERAIRKGQQNPIKPLF